MSLEQISLYYIYIHYVFIDHLIMYVCMRILYQDIYKTNRILGIRTYSHEKEGSPPIRKPPNTTAPKP